MTEELDQIFIKIMNNKVPEPWMRTAYPSEKPLASWILNFLQRIEFMKNWVVNG